MCSICDEIHKRQIEESAYPKILTLLDSLRKKQEEEEKRHLFLVDTIRNYTPEEAASRIDDFFYNSIIRRV